MTLLSTRVSCLSWTHEMLSMKRRRECFLFSHVINCQNKAKRPTNETMCDVLQASANWSMVVRVLQRSSLQRSTCHDYSWLCFYMLILGYGSIPINTIFSGMNIHKSQLFWCSLGARVLTHPHILIYFDIPLVLMTSTDVHANIHFGQVGPKQPLVQGGHRNSLCKASVTQERKQHLWNVCCLYDVVFYIIIYVYVCV